MPTATQMRTLWTAQDQIRAAAERELRIVMSRFDTTDPFVVRDVLTQVMPALVAKYGDVMGVIGAEFFEQVVGDAAIIPDVYQPDAVEESAKWAVGAAFQGNALLTVERASGAMSRHLLQFSRDTIHTSTDRTPGIGYARIMRGASTCAFCTTLAGRGAVYRTSSAADRSYHDRCDCAVAPIRDDRDWPSGYDHKRLEEMYAQARQQAGTTALKGGTPGAKTDPDEMSILQAMRQLHGLK